MAPVLAVVLAAAAIAVTILAYAVRAVGAVAEEFGEDPVRWQLMMLPFGIFGPFVARALLSRRRGGPGPGGPGGYA
jgi:hypothetical protein